jgi:tRNA 2-selenouridine synthase
VPEKLHIKDFLKAAETIPMVDVRSPGEYALAHIPGAFSLPIFNDEERAQVGTSYKQESKRKAVLLGLEIVGPKLRAMAEEGKRFSKYNEILVHCWRGGMRSESMAWLFETTGLKVKLLEGGYKAYRQYMKDQLAQKLDIVIVSGSTGSGKTDILKELHKQGEQIIDLEGLAHHKGSAFGAIGEPEQLSNEMFENELFEVFRNLDLNKRIWIEDESHSIGKNYVPRELFSQMRAAVVLKVNIPKGVRIKRLLKEYTQVDKEILIRDVMRIEKRLGPQHAKACVDAIRADDYHSAIDMALVFYDKAYLNGLNKRTESEIFELEILEDNPADTARKLIEFKNTHS